MRFAKIANRLGSRYRHTIVAVDGNTDCLDRLDPGLDVTLLPVEVEKGRAFSLRNLLRFRKVLRDRRPDLLLTYAWGAVEWGLANRLPALCPHLHFEDGFGPDEAIGRHFRRRIWFRRVALAGPTEVIVPSRLLEGIALESWRIPRQRVRFIPNGIDCARFAAAPDGTALPPRRPGELLVGSVGTLRREKNFGRLLRAFAALPPTPAVRLALIGDGPDRPALEAAARGLGIEDRVDFAGNMMNPARALGLLDVFAISSDTEQMPLSLLEAMAAARPVVSTDVGDVRAMVTDENRPLVVSRDDEAALTAALHRLLTDATLRRRLGNANRARVVREYDEGSMLETYDRLFEDFSRRSSERAA
ncbi:glycosyltransferase family 4 protein [Skermanella pratensis]|uniref:glycosyltransferase family 4 protein n=1 Tax=Skermanella pratensis TaxID=2233999 RepID=UPI001301011D|nr:glycosyltransferase family 4 protein [Skermanella pratensis]